ncbi:MAG TPA: peptidylprolyl isomerase [Candidatus Angelobacter sp.]|nr:peptidylprolyl isomerase [Candidatus Angelobacter sp.]
MTRSLIICILLAVTAAAQKPQNPAAKQAPAAPAATPSPSPAGHPGPPSLLKRDEKPAEVPPNQPVISIRGLCPAQKDIATNTKVPSTAECTMSITKEQFDNLVKAFNSNNQPITQAQRRGLAEKYVELLVISEAAESAGVENTPTYAEVMRVLRLKTLGDLYLNQLAEQYRNPPEQEIEAYYQANQQKYEAAKLSRIYLPKNDPDPKATPEQKQDFEKKLQPLSDDIQARAAKGEDMAKLQKDAYTSLGITAAPPTTDLSLARHGMFPPKLDQEIFSHKAGEVFRSDDASGYMIYRVDSRQTSPLESVKAEISQQLFRQKMEAKTKELNAPVHAEYDDKYFGPPVKAGPPMPPGAAR